jgi:hypothetical protein
MSSRPSLPVTVALFVFAIVFLAVSLPDSTGGWFRWYASAAWAFMAIWYGGRLIRFWKARQPRS